jgi:cupin 2 domain-containing protein
MAEAKAGNLGRGLPAGSLAAELTETLCRGKGLRIERIVSTGQATPEGEWYDQESDEFVLFVAGAARLLIAGEAQARELHPGDWLLLPAHCRHRVTWTESDPPTVWLAIHFAAG